MILIAVMEVRIPINLLSIQSINISNRTAATTTILDMDLKDTVQMVECIRLSKVNTITQLDIIRITSELQ